jgi:methyl-accepting chemotaxis protein
MKGHSPAIERAAGEAAKQLVEVCGLLRTLNQTESESLTQIRGATKQNETANDVAAKLLSLSSELNELARQIKATAEEEVAATNRLIDTAQERLNGLASEVQGLRKDLHEVTKF